MEKNDAAHGPLVQLWLAAVLLTRLPLPHLPRGAFAHGARAVWAYPVVGAGIGLVGAVAGQLALLLGMPTGVAAGITLAVMMMLTGAMHEDGLADVFDGFWGGTTPARRLEIMRDSQIGTYGVLALLMVTLLRWSALAALLSGPIAPVIAAAALSRGMMPAVMARLVQARSNGLAQSVGRPPVPLAVLGFGLGALIALISLGSAGGVAIIAAIAMTTAVAATAKRKIGGQTGDVLGATQQLSEAAILICCAAFVT